MKSRKTGSGPRCQRSKIPGCSLAWQHPTLNRKMASAPTLVQPEAPTGKTLLNLLTAEVKVKVSSGSSKDGKNVLDGSSETCWTSDNLPPNSDPSSSRYLVTFKLADVVQLTSLHSLSLTFAGGFCPMSLQVLASTEDNTKEWFSISPLLHPRDTNAKQYFALSSTDSRSISGLRFSFQGSTDDYGRLTVYQAEIFAAQ